MSDESRKSDSAGVGRIRITVWAGGAAVVE